MRESADSAAPGPARLGDFELARLLGEGGSGAVYDARWGHRRVALKVLHPALVSTPRERQRFFAEARLLAEITHPNVVKVLGVGELPDRRPYLAMELLEGTSLATRLAAGPLGREAALELFFQLAAAVDAMHARGLVHRDLKPENVMLVDGGHYVVLLDFGIAKEVDAPASTVTQDGGVIGTPAYMAPERFFGQGASVSTDIYELTLVLYAMLAGRLPWAASNDPEARLDPLSLTAVGVDVPPALETVVARALSTRAATRPPTVAALCAALERAGAGAARRSAQRASARRTAAQSAVDLAAVALHDDGTTEPRESRPSPPPAGAALRSTVDLHAPAGSPSPGRDTDALALAPTVAVAGRGDPPRWTMDLADSGAVSMSAGTGPSAPVADRAPYGVPTAGPGSGIPASHPPVPATTDGSSPPMAGGGAVPHRPPAAARGTPARTPRWAAVVAIAAVLVTALVFVIALWPATGASDIAAPVAAPTAAAAASPRVTVAPIEQAVVDRALTALPGDAIGYLGVHVPAAAASPMFRELMQTVSAQAELAPLLAVAETCGIDLLRDVQWVGVGVTAGEDIDVVLRSSLSRERVEDCVEQVSAAAGDPLTIARDGAVSTIGGGDAASMLVWLDEKTALFTSRPQVDAAWARARLAGEEGALTGARAALLDKIDRTVSVWLVASRDMLGDEPMVPGAAREQALYGQLELGDATRVAAGLRYASDAEAAMAAAKVQGSLDELKSDPAYLLFGQIDSRKDGHDVLVDASLTPLATQLVDSMIGGLLAGQQ